MGERKAGGPEEMGERKAGGGRRECVRELWTAPLGRGADAKKPCRRRSLTCLMIGPKFYPTSFHLQKLSIF
jgi:hypothetical protein